MPGAACENLPERGLFLFGGLFGVVRGTVIGCRDHVVVIRGGGPDIVEQFGDFEFCLGLGLGGQFLDRLARRLKLGFFFRAGDVQLDRDIDLGVQQHVHVMQAQFLDRLGQCDLFLVDREPTGGGGIGGVTRNMKDPAESGIAE